jgi:CBS domain-containing protein
MHHTVKELMTRDPVMISPESTLKEAAQKMESVGCGILPVGMAGKNPEGVITDRDIVLRAVAKGKDVNREKVKNYMTHGVWFCHTGDTPEKAAKLMRSHKVNRLLVKDEEGQPCGILTFGRILREDDNLQEIGTVIQVAVGPKAESNSSAILL